MWAESSERQAEASNYSENSLKWFCSPNSAPQMHAKYIAHAGVADLEDIANHRLKRPTTRPCSCPNLLVLMQCRALEHTASKPTNNRGKMKIQIIRRGHEYFPPAEQEQMYKLRHEVFRDRLGWSVKTCRGMEFDEFDALDPVYVLVHDEDEVTGCWRMLPTTGPNMLKDVFPELVHNNPVPESELVWELSRFAVRKGRSGSFGLTIAPVAMMYHAVRFARTQGVAQFVTVTNVGVERMLRHLGLNPRRLGLPQQIGVERAVALSFDLDASTERVLATALHVRSEEQFSACAEIRTQASALQVSSSRMPLHAAAHTTH